MQGIAEGLNVPTANVYSYFQNKEKLALAIVRRFGERVSERVGKPDDPSVLPEVKAATLVDVYRQSITDDGQLCLFLVFGAELHTLPEPVQLEVRNFYSHVIEWLQTVLKRTEQYASAPDEETRRVATAIIAAMNGAQLCVRAAGDKSLFDEIVKQQYASGLIPGHDRNGLTDS